jgi:hypothetical protein
MEWIGIFISLFVGLLTSCGQWYAWREQRRFLALQYLTAQDHRLASADFKPYLQGYANYVEGDRSESSLVGFREVLNVLDTLGIFCKNGTLKSVDVYQFFGTFTIRIYSESMNLIPAIVESYGNVDVYTGVAYLHKCMIEVSGR